MPPDAAPIAELPASVITPEAVEVPLPFVSNNPFVPAAPKVPFRVSALPRLMPFVIFNVPPELTVTPAELNAELLLAIKVPALIVVVPP